MAGHALNIDPYSAQSLRLNSNSNQAGNNQITTPEQAYPASIQQSGVDYGNIMSGYQNILGGNNTNPFTNQAAGALQGMLNNNSSPLPYEGQFNENLGSLKNLSNSLSTYNPISAVMQTYKEDPRFSESLTGLKELADTGGLSQDDQTALRARGVSPIRSAYATAQKEISRQRALQGGYSPSFNATTSKLTRGLAGQTAEATQNVNADIAQMVQAGKLSAAPQLTAALSGVNTLQNDINANNTNSQNQTNQFNATGRLAQGQLQGNLLSQYGNLVSNRTGMTLDNKNANSNRQLSAANSLFSMGQSPANQQLQALSGMTNLYGTTPGLAQLYGNQTLQRQQLGMQGQTSANNLISSATRG